MKKFVVVLMVLGLVISGSGMASATGTLLFDRGLPTSNLNNAADPYRSNVTWAFTANPSTPDDRWLVGDDFTIGGSANYFVDTIRIWSTSNTDLSVWFGPAGGTIAQLSTLPVVTLAVYGDPLGYQGNSGAFRPVYQLDINLNTVLSGATTYQFFLDGLMIDFPDGIYPWTSVNDAYLHSSNEAFSVSPQQGADNLMLASNVVSGITVLVEPWDSNGYGWDRSSDGNVQVFGTKVPEPATILLLGLGLVGLAGIGRKYKN